MTTNLEPTDLYSVLLFALYKLTKDDNYAILSTMTTMFDKDTMLKMCALFGGTTITIPTLKELKTMIDALGLFYLTDVQHKELPNKIPKKVQEAYKSIKEVLHDYTIGQNDS